MAELGKAALFAGFDATITTNGNNEITGAIVNAELKNLGDSYPNKLDEDHYFLREYNAARSYKVGFVCVESGVIYKANTLTSGAFNVAHWDVISATDGDMLAANNLSDVLSASTSYDNIKQQGSLTLVGAWESATLGEINTGTDATRVITALGLAGSQLAIDVAANNAKVTNATHTGDVTGSGALTIGAKKVTIGMLADGTDGELLTWNASGVAATVAVGSVGEVLTSNGAGVAPTYQAAGADLNGIYGASGSLSGVTTVTMATNNLTFASTGEANLFKIDAVNDRIGVGIAAPAAKLHANVTTSAGAVLAFKVTEGANFLFGVGDNGNTGIGVSPPFPTRLAVKTKASSTQIGFVVENSSAAKLLSLREDGGAFIIPGSMALGQDANPFGRLHILPDLVNNRAYINCEQTNGSGAADFIVTHLGSTGLGVNLPSAKLHTHVTTTAGANFVFKATAGATTPFAVRDDGNVGIGTVAPAFRLTVNNTVNDQGLLVEHSGTNQAGLLTHGSTNGGGLFLNNVAGSAVLVSINTGITGTIDYINTGRDLVFFSTTNVSNGGKHQIISPYNSFLSTTAPYNSGIYSNDAFAINKGGGLAFGGKYNAGGSDAVFGIISATKANAADGDFEGIMRLSVRPNGGAPVDTLILKGDGNVGLDVSTFGTSASGVLGIKNGTSPTTSPADTIQIGAKDTAGESTSTLELFLEQAVEAIGTFTPSNKIKIVLNGTEYWIQLDAV